MVDRAQKLDLVLEHLASANKAIKEYEASKNVTRLEFAEKQLLEAQGLVSPYAKTDAALQYVQKEMLDSKYRDAMSKAYNALFNNRYSSARKMVFTSAGYKA